LDKLSVGFFAGSTEESFLFLFYFFPLQKPDAKQKLGSWQPPFSYIRWRFNEKIQDPLNISLNKELKWEMGNGLTS
jgi:hypothetical protein